MLHAIKSDNEVYQRNKACVDYLLAKSLLKRFLVDSQQHRVWAHFTSPPKLFLYFVLLLQSSSMMRLPSEIFASTAFSKADSSYSNSQAACQKTQ